MYERVNPIREAISTYSDVNNIFRQDRADKAAVEDRDYNRSRQAIIDQRATETHDATMATAAELKKQRELADDDRILSGASLKVKQFEMERQRNPLAPLPEFDDTEKPVIMRYAAANPTLSNDPAKLAEQSLAGKRLMAAMAKIGPALTNGKKQVLSAEQVPEFFRDANIFLSQELNKGSDKYGNKDSRKELVKAYFDDTNTFRGTLRVTPKDPSQPSYETDMTEGREPGEAKPLAIPALVLDGYMKANTDFASVASTFFASAQAKAGNKDIRKEVQDQLNSEAVKIAQEKVAEAEKEHGAITYDKKRQLFMGLIPRGATISASDMKKYADEFYPKPEKEEVDFKEKGYGQIEYTKGPKKGIVEKVPVKPEKAGGSAVDPYDKIALNDAVITRRTAKTTYDKLNASIGTEIVNDMGKTVKVTSGDVKAAKQAYLDANEQVGRYDKKAMHKIAPPRKVVLNGNAQELRAAYEGAEVPRDVEKSAREQKYSDDDIKFMKGELDKEDVEISFGAPAKAVSGKSGGAPSKAEWMKKAKAANPKASEAELTAYYNQKYGSR